MKNNFVKTYLGIFVAMICWSLSFIWYKDAYLHFGPMTTVFLRLLISATLLISISYFAGILKIKKVHFKLFLAAAFFEPFLYFIGESLGMQKVSAVTASVIVATIPIFTAILASLIYHEKLSIINISGIVISFIGVVMVIITKNFQFQASVSGVLLMFLAVFSAIAYAIALRKLIPHYNPISIVAVQNLIGTVLFAPLFVIWEWNSFLAGFSFHALIPVLNLSIFASSLAFILFAYAVNTLGVSKANTFTNLIPVLTSIFAFFLLKESFTFLKTIGIITVVLGLFMSQINLSFYKMIFNFLNLNHKKRNQQ